MLSTRYLLRLNAVTCITFGIVFLLFPRSVSEFLGSFPELWLRVLGLGLTAHGVHLLFGSYRRSLLKLEVFYFSFGDIAWFLGSLLLLVTTDFINSGSGAVVTMLVALMVVTIGLSQLWAYSEFAELGLSQNSKEGHDFLPAHLTRLSAIGVSLMNMNLWAKWRLLTLSAVFGLAIFFLPSSGSEMAIASYIAAIPLLLAIVIVQRGLTHLLGIVPVLTWLPLAFYLVLRLSSDTAGAQLTFADDHLLYVYSYALLVFVVVSLVFDTYDLVRWVGGKHARFGSHRENSHS